MENNKNKKSVKFQGDMSNFYDFIQVFVFTRNHHLKDFSFSSMGGHLAHPSGIFLAIFTGWERTGQVLCIVDTSCLF